MTAPGPWRQRTGTERLEQFLMGTFSVPWFALSVYLLALERCSGPFPETGPCGPRCWVRESVALAGAVCCLTAPLMDRPPRRLVCLLGVGLVLVTCAA